MKKLRKLTREIKEYFSKRGIDYKDYLLERKDVVDEFGYKYFQVFNVKENKLERYYYQK
ncbi:hypothetical protein H8923_06275 [Romboutsia hominis]|uniref:Uncharacterized protein n=1 Tax=Romboutsia faecis TaxID=2764597 RepID=A0ABR7JN84_9FIRM|nr:hypothetical protein [Romboutsia faecis]MBC5996363.1 hypothetical protein [Romboutsia faecis]